MNAPKHEMMKAIARTCERELNWFNRVLEEAVKSYFEEYKLIETDPPSLETDSSDYANLVNEYSMGYNERLILILSLVPHLRPQLLDILLIENPNFSRRYTEFGGYLSGTHGGFLPTCETAVFILAPTDLSLRLRLQKLFHTEHYFTKDNILMISKAQDFEPQLSEKIGPGQRALDLFPMFSTKGASDDRA